MSREFGSYASGYLHTQIEYAASDLEHGRDATTRAWSKFFRAFHPVAYAICSSEACDSGEDDSIVATIKALPELQAALDEMKQHVALYDRLMKDAVRAALEKKTS
jgi:hypothetical protein